MNIIFSKIKSHYTKQTTPVLHSQLDGIQYWRENILLNVLYVLLVFTFVVYIPSIVLSYEQGLWSVLIIDFFAYPVIIYLFYSKKKSIKFRSVFLLSYLFILSAIIIYDLGLIGAGFYWLFSISPLAAILIDSKTSYLFLVFNFLLFLVLGLLAQFQFISILGYEPFRFFVWATVSINFLFINSIVTVMINQVLKGLSHTLENEKNIIDQLSFKQNELILEKEKAEAADRLKSNFLAQMSHEIRTPINTIVSFLSLIEADLEDKIDQENRTFFTLINKGSLRIIRTVDLLLNLSEIQARSYKVSLKQFDLHNDIIEKIISSQNKSANEKKLELSLIKEADPTEINADLHSVNQIFTHLIENAIKFTDAGKVTVFIKQNNLKKIVVEVIDTGIGIDKEYLEKLFIPFTQEQEGYSRKYEGNGVGLALVKNYCDLNNISINFESQKGKGTKVTTIFN